MQHLIHLSETYPELARAEAEAVLGVPGELFGDLLVFESSASGIQNGVSSHPEQRIALALGVYELLFSVLVSELDAQLDGFNFAPLLTSGQTWKLSTVRFEQQEMMRLATLVGQGLNPFAVDVHTPDVVFTLLRAEERVFVCVKKEKEREDWQKRAAHNRTCPHPTSMHPRLARALVNLTGVPDGGMIVDPMCGSGGFLLEAGLMGLRSIGYDFDPDALSRCVANLKQFGVRAQLFQGDIAVLDEPLNYIAFDLPYGHGSKMSLPIEDLYHAALLMLERCLKKRAVVVCPLRYDLRRFVDRSKLKVVASFRQRVHEHLTRLIVVLEPA